MNDMLTINPLSFLLIANKNKLYNETYLHQENVRISIRGLYFFPATCCPLDFIGEESWSLIMN
jgi:hypothetical protein